MLKTKVEYQKGVAILFLDGKVIEALGDEVLREEVHSLLDQGKKNILINLKGVTNMDSSGIGELVSAFTTIQNKGGVLKLCSVPPKVMDILQITQLVRVFSIYESQNEAIDSF